MDNQSKKAVNEIAEPPPPSEILTTLLSKRSAVKKAPEEVVDEIRLLKDFDLDSKYGPCRGICCLSVVFEFCLSVNICTDMLIHFN